MLSLADDSEIGPGKPTSTPKHGWNAFGQSALFSDEDGFQLAQMDDLQSGKAGGWREYPPGTFKLEEDIPCP